MINKFNNVFVTGDLHLGDVVFHDEQKLIQILKENKFDCIVFGGDSFDPWRGRSVIDLIADYRELFKFLQKVESKVVFIKGNHDQEIDLLRRLGFQVKKKFSYLNADWQRVKVMHGHEFDAYHQPLEFLTKRVVRCEEFVNKFLTKVDKEYAIRFLRLLNNVDLKKTINNFQKSLTQIRNTDVLMFGHTHVPCKGKKNKIKFYNWGGWQRDFNLDPNYITDKNGKVISHSVK